MAVMWCRLSAIGILTLDARPLDARRERTDADNGDSNSNMTKHIYWESVKRREKLLKLNITGVGTWRHFFERKGMDGKRSMKMVSCVYPLLIASILDTIMFDFTNSFFIIISSQVVYIATYLVTNARYKWWGLSTFKLLFYIITYL